MNVFILMYAPAEIYPPTLNAASCLAKKFNQVTIITNRINADDTWLFPVNVKVVYVNNLNSNRQGANTFQQVAKFYKFIQQVWKHLRNCKYSVILLYEPYALLSYWLVRKLGIKKPLIVWYHNHDIYEMRHQRKYSIGWWAVNREQQMFNKLSIFSLPSNERKAYFPMRNFKGAYFFIPNYPSHEFYLKFYQPKKLADSLRLVYQGRISPGHGLEEIITVLPERIQGKKLSLHLKGLIDDQYKEALIRLAKEHHVENDLFFYDLTSYNKVPELAATCHIGIAIFTKRDIMNRTLSTSSNKIYEYAAVGLPVLLYDTIDFREQLGKFQWAIFTDCTRHSLINSLSIITDQYDRLSEMAHKSFREVLNFENNFNKVTDYISNHIQQPNFGGDHKN